MLRLVRRGLKGCFNGWVGVAGAIVGVGWFKSCSDFGLCRVSGTKEVEACSMSFSSYGSVGENSIRGWALVEEFGVSMS